MSRIRPLLFLLVFSGCASLGQTNPLASQPSLRDVPPDAYYSAALALLRHIQRFEPTTVESRFETALELAHDEFRPALRESLSTRLPLIKDAKLSRTIAFDRKSGELLYKDETGTVVLELSAIERTYVQGTPLPPVATYYLVVLILESTKHGEVTPKVAEFSRAPREPSTLEQELLGFLPLCAKLEAENQRVWDTKEIVENGRSSRKELYDSLVAESDKLHGINERLTVRMHKIIDRMNALQERVRVVIGNNQGH